MATPTEMADHGDAFITKLEQVFALQNQAFTLANNSDMFPDITSELMTTITQSRQVLNRAFNTAAVHVYKNRRLAG